MKTKDCDWSSKEIKVKIRGNNQMYSIKIDNDNKMKTPDEIAFEFCREHKVNYSHMPEIVKAIGGSVNKKTHSEGNSKRLFSIEEFIKRLKEKEIKEKKRNEIGRDSKEITSSLRRRQADPFTITSNETRLGDFLTNRHHVIDSMFSKFNMTLPVKNKGMSLIDKSEFFVYMEQSAREKYTPFNKALDYGTYRKKKPMKIVRQDKAKNGYLQMYASKKPLSNNDKSSRK